MKRFIKWLRQKEREFTGGQIIWGISLKIIDLLAHKITNSLEIENHKRTKGKRWENANNILAFKIPDIPFKDLIETSL